MDKISPERRSANMRHIRSKNTSPELAVRSLVHRLGYRFRLHRKDLPGKPDLVFASRHKVIFVHGCFWHQHSGCREGKVPASRRDYWEPKLKKNQSRDTGNQKLLEDDGWEVLTVWECTLKKPKPLVKALRRFLGAAVTKGI
jgi:DNA mismatch endonuclease (patch repair protein)